MLQEVYNFCVKYIFLHPLVYTIAWFMSGVQIISLACDSKLPRCCCWGLAVDRWRKVARRQDGRGATPSSDTYKPLDALTHDALTWIAS